jgi:hypothetical protein
LECSNLFALCHANPSCTHPGVNSQFDVPSAPVSDFRSGRRGKLPYTVRMLERLGTALFGLLSGLVWLAICWKPLVSARPRANEERFAGWPWNDGFTYIVFVPAFLLIGLGVLALFRRPRAMGPVPPVVAGAEQKASDAGEQKV